MLLPVFDLCPDIEDNIRNISIELSNMMLNFTCKKLYKKHHPICQKTGGKKWITAAIILNSTSLIKWFLELKYPLTLEIICGAAKMGNIEILELLYQHNPKLFDYRLDPQSFSDDNILRRFSDHAALSGKVEVFNWMKSKRNIDLSSHLTSNSAIISGSLDILKFLRDHGFLSYSYSDLHDAIYYNQLDILKWLLSLYNDIHIVQLCYDSIRYNNHGAFKILIKEPYIDLSSIKDKLMEYDKIEFLQILDDYLNNYNLL